MHYALPTICLAALCTFNAACADDWPQFLGANRDGKSAEKGLISEFPADGPEVLWRTPLGVGLSGVAIADGMAFTMFQDDTKQYVVAVDAITGKKKWQVNVSPVYENSMGNGPRATPTVVDGTVFVYTGEGVLAAIGAADGIVKWSVNTVKTTGGKPSDYGMASSPLVLDSGVVVHVGASNGCVCCFHKETGAKIWTAGDELAGYSSPIVATLAGRQQIVALVGPEVLAIDPVDGQTLWTYAFETEYNCNTANPVVLDGSSILISAGENHGSAILKVTADGENLNVAEAWTSLGKSSVLRAEWQTPALAETVVYGLDNIGSAGPITNLVCVRVSDGKQLWMEKRFGKSNFVMADGKLFITTMRGELVIGEVSPAGYKETSKAALIGMTRQAPAIANGKLYIRDDKELVCVNVSAK